MLATKTALTAVVAALLLIGCGGAAPATSPTTQPLVTPGGAPTGAAPTEATPTDLPLPTDSAASPGGGPASITPDLPLEELFPDEIGGRPVQPQSASGQSVMTLFSNTDPSKMDDFLNSIGASLDQMSAALAISMGPAATGDDFNGITMLAFRVRDVPGETTLDRFAETIRDEEDGAAEVGTATVGGKNVTTVTTDDDDDLASYLYAVGDVVFIVGGTPELVEEAFTKLP